jgi:prepilin-type N-terminal cleavage/methylation domain-containing protein
MGTSNKQSGLTLLEILIVLGIIAAVFGALAPRLKGSDGKLKVAMRDFTSLGRDIRNQARLKNQTHRLVVSFDKEKPEYWVENAPGKALLKPQTEIIVFEREKEEAAAGFSASPRFKKKVLPNGIYFKQLETQYNKNPIEDGVGYVHFSPEGLVEASVLQLTDGKDRIWSVVFNPLTGLAEISSKAVQLQTPQSN